MKGFKFLVLGTVLAKIFGLLREFLLLSEFGYSQEISSYFSLIAILGIFTFFSDTSIINAIAYPLWLEAKQVIIKINLKIILIITCLVIFLFFYNYFIFDSINNNHLKFLISISIIPLILNSILYSILIFLEKKKEFLIIAAFNGFLYLVLTFYLIEYDLIGLIYSRLITLLLTLASILVIIKDDFKILFGKYDFDRELLKKSVNRFLSVNNVLLFALITRFLSSLLFESKMAVINYSMLIILTFYTVFSKNMNTQLIKNQIKNSVLSKSSKYLYFAVSIIFMLFLLLALAFIPNKFTILNSSFELLEPLKLSIFIFAPIILLGFIDLTRQSQLSNKIKIKPIPLILSIGYYIVTLNLF